MEKYRKNNLICKFKGDLNKTVNLKRSKFDELEEEEEEETTYYEPKYESFKFILSNKFTSLEEFINNE